MYLRRQFLEHIAQTSEVPQGFEIDHANGCYLYDRKGDKYLDLISGFGVNNIGHNILNVTEAINAQSKKYLHSNVYGEHIQSPQVELGAYLADLLPPNLNSFYFLNSGSECIDAAMKLTRLATNRTEIVVCRNGYHGSTLGAESLRSDEAHTSAFRPLIPGIRFIEFNKEKDLQAITHQTAAVITEVVQAEAGVRIPDASYLIALKQTCEKTGTLLVFDEIQTGIGRTGSLFAFQKFGVVPDLLLSGKALGAGLPLAALICNRLLMQNFSKNIPLGYITTFGGNPLSCAAGLAGLKYLIENKMMDSVEEKAKLIRQKLNNPRILEIRNCGLLMAVEFESKQIAMEWIHALYKRKILAEGFLFCENAMRIAPGLGIGEKEIELIHF